MKNQRERTRALLADRPDLRARLALILKIGKLVRPSEYHVTHACNLRCQGCWFFKYDFDKQNKDEKSPDAWRNFLRSERRRGVTAALLIGGEPTLFPDRIRLAVEEMPFVSISSNGLNKLPYEGFERVNVAITLFGGGKVDDELRGIKPNGQRITGLFETALEHYRDDPRVGFVFALSEQSLSYMQETVEKVAANGNALTWNYYSKYGTDDPLGRSRETEALLHEALRLQAAYPEVVRSHPYYIRALLTGRGHWGQEFGYDVCPSISSGHEAHHARVRNGNPVLPLFKVVAPDLKTVNFCCTSGHCSGCRDSQAVISWLLVSQHHFLDSLESLTTWIEIAEQYWSHFVWSPLHRFAKRNTRVTSELRDRLG